MSVLSYLDERIVERFGDACTCGNLIFKGYLCHPDAAAVFPAGGFGQSDLMALVCRRSDYTPTAGDEITIDGATFIVVNRGGLIKKRVASSDVLDYVFVKEG